ncbi:MAG: CpsD/CapB family tyrosine-protein kinase [Thermodesulfobacteriota bacterium]
MKDKEARELHLDTGVGKILPLEYPDSMNAENIKILRGRVLHPTTGQRPESILVASAFPSEGKTFVSVNLSVAIAQAVSESVLLIDCDLRRPFVHNMLNLENQAGLSQYLSGKAKLSELIRPTGIEGLSVITSGPEPENPAELLGSPRMRECLAELRADYPESFLVLDSPPAHITSETNLLAQLVDKVILVVMSGASPRRAIQRVVEDLGRDKILGVVFNGDTETYKYYGKYYKRYYGRYGKDRYGRKSA